MYLYLILHYKTWVVIFCIYFLIRLFMFENKKGPQTMQSSI